MLATAIFCAAAAPVLAESIVQPTVQPGDSWTYRTTTEQRPNVWKQVHSESAVVRNSGARMLIRNTEVGSTNPPTEILINSDWSRFRSIAGQETQVNRPFAFPLAAGKTWDLEYTDDHPSNANHKTEKRQFHYRAVGWEDIEVPAGKFKAFKVESDGTWIGEVAPKVAASIGTTTSAEGSSTAAQTVNVTARTVTGRMYHAAWYAPQVKRFVETVEEYYDTNGMRTERITTELESFKVAD